MPTSNFLRHLSGLPLLQYVDDECDVDNDVMNYDSDDDDPCSSLDDDDDLLDHGLACYLCDENKKMYQMEVEKNDKLEVKNEEMESAHKKNIADLTAEWEERITLLTKKNTALSKQLEEKLAAVTQIAQASLESKKSNKQEVSKSMDDLKAAESKAGDLSKELTDVRQMTSPMPEGSMKLSSDASQTTIQKKIMNSLPDDRSRRHSQLKQNKEGRGRELHSKEECTVAVERIETSSGRKVKGSRRKMGCKQSQHMMEEHQAKHELSVNSLPFHLRN
jgi:hypothetical protein